jgi:nucleoside-diphosphate-sugar epimerase
MPPLKIFVTGATGMVGIHIVQHMLEKGHEVTALVRRSSDTSRLKALPGKLDIRTTELDNANNLGNIMKGHQVVIHCAGSVDPHATRDEIFGINVGGTEITLRAAIDAGIKQFIHMSSLSVITGQEDQFNVDENAPLRTCGEAYADSKVEAEKLVISLAGTGEMKVTILRPGFIYGPGERAWMPRLINNIRTGKAMLIDGGSKETNVIYVGNLCRAAELSMLNEKAYNRVYNLTDGQKVSKKELFDAIADGLGFPRIKRTIPSAIARPVCEIVSGIAPMLPPEKRQGLSRFSRAAYRLAGINQGFSIARAEQELGYVNRTPFPEGMARTLETFKTPGADQSLASSTR